MSLSFKADVIVERLSLVLTGPLQGKYIYKRDVHTARNFLKACSSVLGQSYITTKSFQLLISDNLDPSVLLSNTGAFEAFKKGCTTVCTGSLIGVQTLN